MSPLGLDVLSTAPTQTSQKPGVTMGKMHPAPGGPQLATPGLISAHRHTLLLPAQKANVGIHPASQVNGGASGRMDNKLAQTCSGGDNRAEEEIKKGPLHPICSATPGQLSAWLRAGGQDAGDWLLPQQIWRGSQRKQHRPRAGGR